MQAKCVYLADECLNAAWNVVMKEKRRPGLALSPEDANIRLAATRRARSDVFSQCTLEVVVFGFLVKKDNNGEPFP